MVVKNKQVYSRRYTPRGNWAYLPVLRVTAGQLRYMIRRRDAEGSSLAEQVRCALNVVRYFRACPAHLALLPAEIQDEIMRTL